MASAQVCRYNATQRNKAKIRSVSVGIDRYERLSEKAKELVYPRTTILEYLIDHFLDQITEVALNASSMRRRLQ